MIRINLIPEHVPATSSKTFLTETATIAAILAAAYYAPSLYADRLRSEAEAISQETAQKQAAVQNLKVEGQTIATFKKTIGDLKGRSSRIKNLTIGRKQPVFLLDSLQQQHPERLWLDRISLEAGQMKITGYSSEPELISEYATRIRSLNDTSKKPEVDIETFIPPFHKYLKGQTEDKTADEAQKPDSIMPLVFNDITINKSELAQVSNNDVYQFEIQTQVSLPGGL
jgi:Tfp pilus assembly protein PilN